MNEELLFRVRAGDASLTEVKLSGTRFAHDRLGGLCAALRNNHVVSSLDLSSCALGSDGARIVADLLKSNSSVLHLDLSSNKLDAKCADMIASMLEKNDSLTSLNLAHNVIGASGASSIARALARNTSLCSVNLASNRIGVTGITKVAHGLKENRVVSSLVLIDNTIADLAGADEGQGVSAAEKLCARAMAETLEGSNFVVLHVELEAESLYDKFLARNLERRDALFAAVKSGNVDVVRELLRLGVNTTSVVDGCTVFHVAMDGRNWECLEELLRYQCCAIFIGSNSRQCAREELCELLTKFTPAKSNLATIVCGDFVQGYNQSIDDALLRIESIRAVIGRSAKWKAKLMGSSASVSSLLFAERARVFMDVFGSIVKVDLSYLNLDVLPAVLGCLPDTITLDLSGNPLSAVPPNVIQGDTASILQYVREGSKIGGRVTWKRAKVMVLGKEGVGKTHLFHRLRNAKGKYENVSTNGLSVNEFKLGEMELTWFDFGGQEIFYPTHQFFLTPQCLYIIVFDLNDKDSSERVLYWLRMIDSLPRSANRPTKTILVGTHADMMKEKDLVLVQQRMEHLIDRVVAFVPVSCKTGKGFDMLQDIMGRAIDLGKLGTMEVPFHYLTVWQWMCTNRGSIPQLEWNLFRDHFPNFSVMQLEGACRFLSHVGQCFYSCKEDLSIVVLNVQYLADLFSGVISFFSGVRDGVVALDRLRHTWKGLDDVGIICRMKILERFEMAFPKITVGLWVVPSMLKEVPANLNFLSGGKAVLFGRVYNLDVLPVGLMGRLIARLQELRGLRIVDMWRNGLQYESEDGSEAGQALVVQGQHLQLSELRLQAKVFKRTGCLLYQQVAFECAALLKSMFFKQEEFAFDVRIMCPHCLASRGFLTPTLLAFEKCIDFVVSRAPTFKCGTSHVPSVVLTVDVSFGNVRTLGSEEVNVECQPFAAGSFGVVFKGRFLGEKQVVVKELNAAKVKKFETSKHSGCATNGEMVAKGNAVEELRRGFGEFVHEASLMSQFSHPNIVGLYGIMLNPLRLVMELCPVGDLFAALRSQKVWNGPIPEHGVTVPPICFRLALDVASGMRYMHALDPPIAHRDLRSPNVLLMSLDPCAPVCAKVSDFGLSAVMTARQQDALSAWQWTAPEAQIGSNYTHLCDLYSFAMIVWEIFTQQVPFGEFSEKFKEAEIHRRVLEPVNALRPTVPSYIPAWIAGIIKQLWAFEPLKRSSFAEVEFRIKNSGRAPWVGVRAVLEPKYSFAPLIRAVCDGVDSVSCITKRSSESWIGTKSGNVRVFSLQSLKERRSERVEGLESSVPVLAICNVSVTVMWIGLSDGTIRLWNESNLNSSKSFKSPRIKNSLKSQRQENLSSMCFVTFFDVIIRGDSSGKLEVLSLCNTVLCEFTLPQPVMCMCVVDDGLRVAWVGSGTNLYRVEYTRDAKFEVKLLVENALDMAIQDVVCCENRVICISRVGAVRVFSKDGRLEYAINLSNSSAHCMCVAEVNGSPTIWLGCRDEIVVLDKHARVFAKLRLPDVGEVTCMANLGSQVWTSVSSANNWVVLGWCL